jgi:hypothetical protein
MPISAVLNFEGYCGRDLSAPELMKARWELFDLRQKGNLSSEAWRSPKQPTRPIWFSLMLPLGVGMLPGLYVARIDPVTF